MLGFVQGPGSVVGCWGLAKACRGEGLLGSVLGPGSGCCSGEATCYTGAAVGRQGGAVGRQGATEEVLGAAVGRQGAAEEVLGAAVGC